MWQSSKRRGIIRELNAGAIGAWIYADQSGRVLYPVIFCREFIKKFVFQMRVTYRTRASWPLLEISVPLRNLKYIRNRNSNTLGGSRRLDSSVTAKALCRSIMKTLDFTSKGNYALMVIRLNLKNHDR